jgi:O-antigen/teichoic acid export membrane protein
MQADIRNFTHFFWSRLSLRSRAEVLLEAAYWSASDMVLGWQQHLPRGASSGRSQPSLTLPGRAEGLMRFIDRMKRSSFARDIGHLTAGQGLRLVIQAVYFVLIARILGPSRYGAFASIVALTGVLTPFSGLGMSNLFIKNVRSGRRGAALCWGNGLAATMVSGAACVAATFVTNIVFHLRIPLGVLAGVCCSDLILMRVTELAMFGFGAIGRMKQNAIQAVISSALRLAAIALLLPFGHRVTLLWWTWAYFLATGAGTTYAVWRAHGAWGRPEFNLASLLADAREGLYFSIGTSAATVYNYIDKVMLAKVSFAEVGIYAAYRIIDVSMTPVRALVSAAYPHFFRLGVGGVRPTWGYARTQIGRAFLYSLILAPALWIGAPLLPRLVGAGYVLTVPALRWLALLPPIRSVHSFLADALSGAGHQGLRSAIQVAVALVNFGLNLVILPKYGWLGAAWTSLASDGLLLLCLWAAVQHCLGRESEAALATVDGAV